MGASTPGQVLGRQVRRWREERKLSAQALANRLAEIGSNLDRRAVFKIETESRGVSVDEWLQLAHALAVPPPLLFLDLDSGEDITVAPNVVLHPWVVWQWIAGEHASPVPSERGGALVSRVDEFTRARTAVHLYKQEEASSEAVSRATMRIRAAEYTGNEDQLRIAKSDRVDNLRILADTLDSMIENGMTPPGKSSDVIEAIRMLGMSRYPDRLEVWDGAVDPDAPRADGWPGGPRLWITEEAAADFRAAQAQHAVNRKPDEA